MVTYDANVIHGFAEALYARARTIMLTHTLIGGLVGAFAWLFLGGMFASILTGDLAFVRQLGWVLFVGVCALVGLSIGRSKAFLLKLQAQLALCQVRIEANTRT